jgi:hypothetical protein
MLLREGLGTQFNNYSVPDNHSIFYPFLLQTCFRSTFILLTPSRLWILCLDRMPEFLPGGYSTWSWTTSSRRKFHSFISQVLLLKEDCGNAGNPFFVVRHRIFDLAGTHLARNCDIAPLTVCLPLWPDFIAIQNELSWNILRYCSRFLTWVLAVCFATFMRWSSCGCAVALWSTSLWLAAILLVRDDKTCFLLFWDI